MAALWGLWTQRAEAFYLARFYRGGGGDTGDAVSCTSRIAVADKIGSRALRADAMEAVTSGWLSFVVLISLAAQWAFGMWWIDSVGSLAIVLLLVKEGRERLGQAKSVVVPRASEAVWPPMRLRQHERSG